MTNGKQKNCNEIGYVAFESKVGKKKVESRNFGSGKWKVEKKKVESRKKESVGSAPEGRTLDRGLCTSGRTNVSDGNVSEADFSFSPRFAYRNGAWSFEMLRF
jgi:hypothetical protein